MGSESASVRKENESELVLTFRQHCRTHTQTPMHTHSLSWWLFSIWLLTSFHFHCFSDGRNEDRAGGRCEKPPAAGRLTL